MSDSETEERQSSGRSSARFTFSGEKDDFDEFKIGFLNQAQKKKYMAALMPGGERDLPASWSVDLSASDDATKKQKAARERLFNATADLVLALKGVKAVRAIIKNSCSDEWPQGRADIIWEKICAKYAPRDALGSRSGNAGRAGRGPSVSVRCKGCV